MNLNTCCFKHITTFKLCIEQEQVATLPESLLSEIDDLTRFSPSRDFLTMSHLTLTLA